MSITYEIILYTYGGGIFNIFGKQSLYRPQNGTPKNKVTLHQFISDSNIYENKKISKSLWFLFDTHNNQIIENIIFANNSSIKRYIKNNKDMLKEKYGTCPENYYLVSVNYSHYDIRATHSTID